MTPWERPLSDISRRDFIQSAIGSGVSMLAATAGEAADRTRDLGVAAATDASKGLAAPPRHATYSELPLSSIEPLGWLKAYLEKQRDGLTGHLDETGGFPFNTYGWAGPGISPDDSYAYEQTGYWVDGMMRCAHLLRDVPLIEKASTQTRYVLDHPDADGYLGPSLLKRTTRWPHVVFFRALCAQGSATGDSRIPTAIRRHFLASPYPYLDYREACNLEAVLWAYQRTGDPALIELAEELYRKFERSAEVNGGASPATYCDGKPSEVHGATYNELGKLGALLYMHTGNRAYLDVSIAAYKKLDDFHMLVDGVHSSSERMRDVTPLESHETCVISDYTWSLGYLLMATGDAEYADKIERACFNAAPGAVTEDFTALQYFSSPNQVVAAHNTNHNVYFRGDRTMAYATAHIAACCPGNVNRAMPNFASRLWMEDGNNGLVAALYAPSKVTYRVGAAQQEVTIAEQTRYPFSDQIVFVMNMKAETEFAFTVRVPRWCDKPRVMINGQPLNQTVKPGTFVRIFRTFRDGDEVRVFLPQETRATTWPSQGIALERGPIVYSLRIQEEWESLEKRVGAAIGLLGVYNLQPRFPGLIGHNVYPKSPWNYALDVDPEQLNSMVQVRDHEWSDERPWSASAPPMTLEVPACRVTGWDFEKPTEITLEGNGDDPGSVHLSDNLLRRKGDFLFTPPLPARISGTSPRERVTLVPYGCAKLRMTVFPRVDRVKA
jgi:hypothetical protein